MAKRRKYKKRSSGVKLKKNTIYTLFALGSIGLGLAMIVSYTRGNEFLTMINLYLVGYFGWVSFTIPILVVLFGLMITGIKASFARANVFLGFLLTSVSLMGLFQSGYVGEQEFLVAASVFTPLLSVLIFLIGVFLGFVVLMNLSPSQIFEGVNAFVEFLGTLGGKVAPLFKSTKKPDVNDMKQFTIKGLKDEPVAAVDAKPLPPPKNEPKKDGPMSDKLILNAPQEMGVWEYPPMSLLSVHAGSVILAILKKLQGLLKKLLRASM